MILPPAHPVSAEETHFQLLADRVHAAARRYVSASRFGGDLSVAAAALAAAKAERDAALPAILALRDARRDARC